MRYQDIKILQERERKTKCFIQGANQSWTLLSQIIPDFPVKSLVNRYSIHRGKM